MEKLSEQAAARASLKSSQRERVWGAGAGGGSAAAGAAQTTAGQGWPGEAAARQHVCAMALLLPGTQHPLPSHVERVPSWESVPPRGWVQLV